MWSSSCRDARGPESAAERWNKERRAENESFTVGWVYLRRERERDQSTKKERKDRKKETGSSETEGAWRRRKPEQTGTLPLF